MLTRDSDTRAVTLVDIPTIRRLVDKGAVLDNELEFTRSDYGPNSSLITTVLLPQRGVHTLITRADKQQVVGQFRLKTDDPVARVAYVAPTPDPNVEDTAWLHVLDAMVREAGKHGAHALLAEVEECDPLFETMRVAGYAVYARQEIWMRPAGETPRYDYPSLELGEEAFGDAVGVQSLFANTVPSLVQQYTVPSADMPGLIYRHKDRTSAFIAYVEGKNGIYLTPYLHPDILSDAPAILESALRQITRSRKLPVYVCVRRYQDWIMEALAELAFVPQIQQAVMVKHISAGVRHACFTPLHRQLEIAPGSVQNPHPFQYRD